MFSGVLVHAHPTDQFGADLPRRSPVVRMFWIVSRVGLVIVRTADCKIAGGNLLQQQLLGIAERAEFGFRQGSQIARALLGLVFHCRGHRGSCCLYHGAGICSRDIAEQPKLAAAGGSLWLQFIIRLVTSRPDYLFFFTGFLAGTFFAGTFFAQAFLAGVFFTTAFFCATFFAGAAFLGAILAGFRAGSAATAFFGSAADAPAFVG